MGSNDDLISRSEAEKKLHEYAEQKFSTGEIELANGILKAKCFIRCKDNVPSAKMGSDGNVIERIVEHIKGNSMIVATSKEFWDNPQNGEYVEEVIPIESLLAIIREEAGQSGWIPVSNTPKKADRYLCDALIHCDDANARRIVIAMYDGQWRNAKGTEILAWQPLPTPYQKGEEN